MVSWSWLSEVDMLVDFFCLEFSSIASLNSARPANWSTASAIPSILAAIWISKYTKLAIGKTSMRDGMAVFGIVSLLASLGACIVDTVGPMKELGTEFRESWSFCTAKFISPINNSILDDLVRVFIIMTNSFRTSEKLVLNSMHTSLRCFFR